MFWVEPRVMTRAHIILGVFPVGVQNAGFLSSPFRQAENTARVKVALEFKPRPKIIFSKTSNNSHYSLVKAVELWSRNVEEHKAKIWGNGCFQKSRLFCRDAPTAIKTTGYTSKRDLYWYWDTFIIHSTKNFIPHDTGIELINTLTALPWLTIFFPFLFSEATR